ncbi:MAG: bifunctional UDP-N-acetylglucosamine diphosphorylase/glucosamine-1-phosphate N-acetyltransferase GlmU [Anaerolineales bacterium]
MAVDVIILAAGKGTRMLSDIPKPLHSLLGKPMIDYVIEAAAPVADHPPVLVVGHGSQEIQQVLGDKLRYVEQTDLLGTGHAVRQAESLIKGKSDLVLVVYGDMPLVRTETLKKLVEAQQAHNGPLSILTLVAEDPRGFGRIFRDEKGGIRAIVEEADATTEQLAIKELNAGMYCFQAEWLWKSLSEIPLSPKGEYYLTDLIGIAVKDGQTVASVQIGDPQELLGINTRVHLAEASQILRGRVNRSLMEAGVSLIDPASTYIEPGVKIGQDTVIQPNTYLEGKTVIGNNCLIGPGTRIVDSQVGNGCEIEFSVIEESRLEDGVDIGPFSHLRKGAHLAAGVHVGNFGEIKDSYLGEGTKMGHFSYLGNAQVGKNVNIGAGTITCNYDGKEKHQTVIKDNVFIGSDSMLVAPLEIGENSTTGAGSVVTKDVPPDSVVVGVPARVIRRKDRE